MPKSKYFLLGLSLIFSATLPLGATGAKLYKWVDDDGNVYYSDKVPPEHSHSGRARLNERGIEVERVEAAKTKEELAQEAELERLREAQQRLIEEQRAADQVLLRTFRTEEDINMARDGKLAAIDGQIGVIRGNINRLQRQLESIQQRAADSERQGEKVSERYLEDMASIRQQIEGNQTAIIHREQDKQQIRDKYGADLDRFHHLKNPGSTRQVEVAPENSRSALLGSLVSCSDDASCNQVWKQVEAYVHQHATTPLQTESNTIIMTASPKSDQTFSLTVSRIRNKETRGAEIFLDLQCKNSPKGMLFCESEAVKAIQNGFAAAITAPSDK